MELNILQSLFGVKKRKQNTNNNDKVLTSHINTNNLSMPTDEALESYGRAQVSIHKKEAETFKKKNGTTFVNPIDLTYEQLLARFRNEMLSSLKDEFWRDYFLKNCGQEDTIIEQYEMFNTFKKLNIYPADFRKMPSVLASINKDNLAEFQKILEKVSSCLDGSYFLIENILLECVDDNKTREFALELCEIENIPLKTIFKYVFDYYYALKEDQVKAKQIRCNAKNDPLVKTINAINSTNVDLVPKDMKPTPLDVLNIKPSSLVLVHMTNYEPENGKISSTRDKIGGTRNSVHFTLNHPVAAHRAGDWDEMNYAIIMPYESTINSNSKNKFIEGMPNDIYTHGSVDIPEGSIIVKYTPELDGEIKFSKHPTLTGVRIIEISVKPHDVIPYIIEKMGYTYCGANALMGLFSQDDAEVKDYDKTVAKYDAWARFCETQKIKPNRHTGSLGNIIEEVIESIGLLQKSNSWLVDDVGKKYNFKKHCLEALKYAKTLEKDGYFSYLDLDKLINLIKKSASPIEAIDEIQKEFKIHPVSELDFFILSSNIIPIELYSEWYKASKDRDDLLKYLSSCMRYYQY